MVEVYKHSHYLPFLKEALDEARPSANSSLQQVASSLGYRSQRSLGMILSGERMPSSQMIQALGKALHLDSTQKRYFELLVLHEKSKRSNRPTTEIAEELKEINSGSKTKKTL